MTQHQIECKLILAFIVERKLEKNLAYGGFLPAEKRPEQGTLFALPIPRKQNGLST
jgi:hypothetical protein